MAGSGRSDLVRHDVLASNDSRLCAMTKRWLCLFFLAAL